MVTYVAIPWQVYHLTGSSLAVGLIGLAELGPLLVTAFVGGALADAVDRRRMVQAVELAFAVCSALLLANALSAESHVWPLFVLAGVMAGLDGLQRPSLEALAPRLVDRDELTAEGALSSFRSTLGLVLGPLLAGLLIATAGLPAAYGFDLVTFTVSLTCLALMRAVPPPPDAERPSLAGVVEGFRYAASRPELVGTYGVDMVAMFFGMPEALFPALGAKLGGPGVVGLLFAAPSVGALLATLTSGWTARVRRHGLAVMLAAAGWGAGIVVCGLAPGIVLACGGLVVAGFADMLSGIFRSTIWNQTIPDRLRGRLAGIEQISYSSGPLLGNVEGGLVAALVGVRASIVSGGVLCIAGVAVAAAAMPAFRHYDARAAAAA